MTAPRLAAYQHRGYCARASANLLRVREDRYPAYVNGGKLSAAAAAIGLELMRCIVAQWRWVVDPAAPEQPAFDDHTGLFGAHNFRLVAELEGAARRARAQADRAPTNWEAGELADLYDALAWHQHADCPGGDPRIVVTVNCERRTTFAVTAGDQAKAA